MSVNFCLPQFQPKITTSTVCTDGYGVENLINFNPLRGGWKGFMAESFIKPPIDITIEFPIKICIEKILLDPCVGRQKSSGFEIYSASVAENNTAARDCDKIEPIFTRIANTLIPWSSMPEDTCVRLRFINNSYRASFPDIKRLSPQRMEVNRPGDVERFLRMASPGAVENINRITIRITRSHGGSVIAMRSVQIWGEPSLRISKPSQLWALKLIENMYAKKKLAESGNTCSKQTSAVNDPTCATKTSSAAIQTQSVEETNECPEDFLDPITCQMIMIPILLPSGHTVDRSTLDRHNDVEAVWGRCANDPFTGVVFSGKSQPVPNVKLKTRIDQYLLKSGDKYTGLARDVGRTAATTALAAGPSASMLVSQKMHIPTRVPPSHATPQQICRPTRVSRHNGEYSKHCPSSLLNLNIPKPSDHGIEGTNLQKRVWHSKEDQPSQHQQRLTKKAKVSTIGVRRGNEPSLSSVSEKSSPSAASASRKGFTSSHEDSLTDSLDSALNEALGSLPSYSSRPSLTLSSNCSTNGFPYAPPVASCTVCQVEVNSTLNGTSVPAVTFYRLPCTHLICRACLVTAPAPAEKKSSAPNPSEQETRFCTSCGRTYRKDDVVRVHL